MLTFSWQCQVGGWTDAATFESVKGYIRKALGQIENVGIILTWSLISSVAQFAVGDGSGYLHAMPFDLYGNSSNGSLKHADGRMKQSLALVITITGYDVHDQGWAQ
jgi:hypothetical protein